MSDIAERLAGLSPEKRALLMQQLGRQAAASATAAPAIVRRARPERLPLSAAQQRLWILDRLDPNSAAYNVTLSIWLDGPLDVALLRRTLTEIARRHESLRTVIGADDAGPFQRILAPASVPIESHDVREHPSPEAAAFELARAEARRPFSIASGPVFRSVLVRTSESRHLLVLNAHHVAIDGWSLGLLLDELRRLYDAFARGEASPLPDLAVQYADYALWQQEQLAGPGIARQLDYWREKLGGRLPVLELPGDRPRPAVQSHRGAVHRATLPADVVDGAKRLARETGCTLFMVVLAAWQSLLMRYSGQTDIIVGAGVANRRHEELEPLIGFFVNTLALRGDLSGHPTFRELLARVKDTTLGAYSNQDVPIERVLEELDVERALSHSPLFQTMVFFQNFPTSNASPTGLTLEPIYFDRINSGTARCDLSLFAAEDEGALLLLLEYATDLFDEDTVARLCAHFANLLAGAVAEPDTRIDDIELLSTSERERLLVEWNDTARAQPSQRTVHDLILAQCERSPEAIAVDGGGKRMTYAELDAASAQIAARLAGQGVRPGDLVGLMVERKPPMLVGLLGILRAGAAYVPMDPSYPAERLQQMLEDSRARVVVSERAVPRLAAFQGVTLLLDDESVQQPTAVATVAVDPSDLAYVIFTSGSTGRPKGIAVPHGAVVNFLQSMARAPGMASTDVVCAVTTLSFDIAVLELLLPLTVGARVALADRNTATDAAALAALIDASGATVMQATPSTWRMLLDSGWHGARGLRVLCGGEGLPRELASRLLAVSDEVWNLYGPTETTVWSTAERVAADGAVLIGRPIDNTRVYIVDRTGRPVPVGVPGELLIGGDGVARGYLARPDLTAEKFIPDPFGATPGARLYRSGDLARWRPDGRIEVVGRCDHQIKLRGFRIEPGEIEAVLLGQTGVSQAVVICREDRPGDRRLVAYVTGNAPTTATLRDALRASLPDYMLPSAFVVLEALPLTPNGKIDRRALPAPESTPDADRVLPRSSEEASLAALWAEILGVDAVGIHDDFFALGGHSLLATQLLTRIQREFGGDIPLRMLFEAPTVAGFAHRLLQSRAESVDADALAGMLDQLEGLSDDDIQALLGADPVL